METAEEKFGQFKGQDVIKYTLTNANQVSISVLNYGGIWQGYLVPGKDGKRHNLLLSADSFAAYQEAGYSINRVIGPTAGRIEQGQFTIDGQDYQVATNENGNAPLFAHWPRGRPAGPGGRNTDGHGSGGVQLLPGHLKIRRDTDAG